MTMKRPAVKSDWETLDMPEKTDHFTLDRVFSEEEMTALRMGNVPQEMEDKWFFFMEGDTLYAHRSWTGTCIFIIEFRAEHKHLVTVNRDPDQYSSDSIANDRETLNRLLDRWVRRPYDYYGEWIEETVTAIEKNKAK